VGALKAKLKIQNKHVVASCCILKDRGSSPLTSTMYHSKNLWFFSGTWLAIILDLNMKIYKKYIIFALAIILVAGCVSTPTQKKISFNGPVYNIDGADYIPLSFILKTYSLDYDWDSVAKKLVLYRDRRKVVLGVGSNVALVDGVSRDLDAPVLIRRSIIMLPKDFSLSVVAKLYSKRQKQIVSKDKVVLPPKCDFAIAKIVVDPGHGGKDPGAIGKLGLREKYVVLDVAKRLKAYLENACIEAQLTRSDDRFISLWKRADIANKSGADFFISIHANAARSRYAKGFEVYYLSEAIDDDARAIAAAENASLKYENSSFGNRAPSNSLEATLWDIENTENRVESIELAESIATTAYNKLGVKNRGVKSARFYVLKGARVPSVLIEIGFVSNYAEAKLLKTGKYREELARAIADGIIAYKREYETTEGFTR